MSDSLTSLTKKEEMRENERFAHFFEILFFKNLKENLVKQDFRFLRNIFLSESLICSFSLSNLSESLMVAHFLFATWAIRSRLLISSLRPERIAHIHSFDLSKMSEWVMSKFPALQIVRFWLINEVVSVRIPLRTGCVLVSVQYLHEAK